MKHENPQQIQKTNTIFQMNILGEELFPDRNKTRGIII
jgi:hypothetical protein